MSQSATIPLQVRLSLGAPSMPAREFFGKRRTGFSSVQRRVGPPEESLEKLSAPDDSYLDKFDIESLPETSFHWRTALSLALASRLAYASPVDVNRIVTQTWRMRTCDFLSADETQCFVATTNSAVLLSFRGSESLGDWLANFNISGTRRPYGTVHRGIFAGYQAIERQLLDKLDHFPGLPILLTGHSLGGALAVIAAAEWQGKRAISSIHTFGQPATGTRDSDGKRTYLEFMEEHYGSNYFRFVNNDDIVPMVPPHFTHTGRLIHFDGDGDLERLAGSEEIEALEIDLGPLLGESSTMDERQFDLLRAALLVERAQRGGAPMHEESVERAALEVAMEEGVESLGGLIPSAKDHRMNHYVAKIAYHAGF